MYIYTYIYICIRIHMYMYTDTSTYTHTCTDVHVYVCIYIYIYSVWCAVGGRFFRSCLLLFCFCCCFWPWIINKSLKTYIFMEFDPGIINFHQMSSKFNENPSNYHGPGGAEPPRAICHPKSYGESHPHAAATVSYQN